ncbi:hypothetical protein C2S53_003582 [Perilla frutescens var. hirtella]|uniref:Uncharacterized protein n=1 Tax=Perilla frutescens var. hirtella TaxID=608512 RepID=A0AAD4IWC4_PERFH|nr:hypothetical protein C2S53_003582 [Perilla frutescens var. hirtella]
MIPQLLISPPSANDVLVGDAFGASLDKYMLEEEEEETTGSHDPTGGGGGKIAAAAAAAADGLEEVSIFIAESEEEEGGNGGAAADDAGKDENEPDSRRSCWLFDEDEELNRKFEDFIRKMKEDIIINEARQKSLMLN